MITKFEKQVVALLLAVTMCLAAVLSCGAAAYAGEIEPAAEAQTGESVTIPEETSAAPSEETPVVMSEEALAAPSEETPVVTSMGGPVVTSEETSIGESEKENNGVEGDVAENGRKAARAALASEGDYEYAVLADDSVAISKYNGTETEVSVPGTLGGKTVSSIGESAFERNDTIEKVTLPASVTSIQYASFYGCTNLKNVELSGNNLKTIEKQAFEGSGLTEFVAPSVETVEAEAFGGCNDLENVVFGKQLKSLGAGAFYWCLGLRSVQISESALTRIENDTFWWCENLSQIELPNSLKSIGNGAFYNTGLETIKIPDSVEEIGSAFSSCRKLVTVELPKSLKVMERTFSGCQDLTSIELPNSLKKIGESTFNGSGLMAIEIPDSVEEIGRAAFSYCQNLTSATIGNGVAVVGAKSFEGSALTTVTIGNRVEMIDSYAFAKNRELSKVVIPQNVTRLEYAVFENCETLADITFPDTLTKIEGHALDGTAWYAGQADGSVYAGKVLYHYKGDMPAEASVKLQDGTKGIAAFAFYECKNLKEIEIPEGVTNIGRFAFYDAGAMSSVRIPASVTEIGRKALGYFESQNGTPFYDGVDDVNEAGSEVGCYEKIPGFTIYGRTGSAAQKYAGENGFIFVAEDPKLEIVLDVTDKAYLIGSGSNAIIKCTGELKDFVSVAVDGQIVDSSCYTLAEGSTVLTFLSSYLDTLSVGDHVVTLNYTYGSIDTTLTIMDRKTGSVENTNQNGNAQIPANANNASGNANQNIANGAPKTGDTSPLYVMCLLFLSSGIGILIFVTKRKNDIRINITRI